MTINSSTGQISWQTNASLAGNYPIDVKATDLAGNVAVDPNTGQADLKFSLAVVVSDTISGTVFEDFDGNGLKGSSEVGLSGMTVYLDENNNSILDGGDVSTTTDSNGNFSFTNLDGWHVYGARSSRPVGLRLRSHPIRSPS